jgi:hypothetical protein
LQAIDEGEKYIEGNNSIILFKRYRKNSNNNKSSFIPTFLLLFISFDAKSFVKRQFY